MIYALLCPNNNNNNNKKQKILGEHEKKIWPSPYPKIAELAVKTAM
jgi:hypothetical protein